MDEISQQQIDSAMSLAISEARMGAGFVSPNPQVGCVILDRTGKVLSKGYHKKIGGPHAEVDALLNLGDNHESDPSRREELLRGATVIVTLEPCAHEGRTPSCAKALAKLPIRRVIYGLVDPNPLVSGQGASIIQAAGIEAVLYQGTLTSELEEVCEHFLVNFSEKRPFISLKVASSLDGQMALASGESKWITSEASRLFAHYLRATHEAILIGQKTLEIDNPSLNVRHPDFAGQKNHVIVLLGSNYAHLKPRDLNLFKAHEESFVHFLEFAGEGYFRLRLNSDGRLARTSSKMEINKDFTWIENKKPFFNSILVEGGAQVLSSFIAGSLADRLYLFQAPLVLGAKGGKAWSQQVTIDSMANKITLRNSKVSSLGPDFLITGRWNRTAKI